MMRPRVGHIQFLNCLPLYYGLVKNQVLLEVELLKGTPTELNRFLLEGKLDIAPISSIEYCRNWKDLLLLPDLTVSSDGEVKSILLISKIPLTQLKGKWVALTNTSATSQALLKIILAEGYNLHPHYFESPPDLSAMLLEAEAALLIGDHALRALVEPRQLLTYDLGIEWKRLSGKKMVYAVWAVRKEFALAYPELVKEVYQAFLKSMRFSLKNIESIAKDAARFEPFTPNFLKDYFESLRFEFGSDYQEGLKEFLKRAKRIGLVKEAGELNFVEVN